MYRLIRSCLLCCALSFSGESSRILGVFPTPSVSHHVVFRPLTNELARRGHKVEVITTDPTGHGTENLREIDVKVNSYQIFGEVMRQATDGDKDDIGNEFHDFNKACLKMYEEQAAVAEVKNIIKDNKSTFDLLLAEAWVRLALGFSRVVKGPVIAVSSFGALFDNCDIIGAPSHPFLYQSTLITRVYNLTLWEKVTQYYYYCSVMNKYKNAVEYENDVVRRVFGEDTPSLSELQNKVDLLFLNMHPVWEGNRPVPTGVVHIGGIHLRSEKDLPQDLKQYLDSSVHGVIYLSFGTNFDTTILSKDQVQNMINVFSQLPYDVLWKWNEDELQGRTEKIRISKWFPQSDLLKHPKIKLFIMQGGLQSIEETIAAGVPVIGIPMSGDQYSNVERFEFHKIGKKIYLEDVNEETLKNTIKSVVEDESYRKNVIRLRAILNDQPQSSLDRAIWWTEHVLRHGARHLRAPAATMHWADYFELELVVIILVTTLTVILLGYIALCKTLFLANIFNRS